MHIKNASTSLPVKLPRLNWSDVGNTNAFNAVLEGPTWKVQRLVQEKLPEPNSKCFKTLILIRSKHTNRKPLVHMAKNSKPWKYIAY